VGVLSNLEWDETRQAKWLTRRIMSDLRLGIELTSYYHTVDLVGYRGKTNFKGILCGTDCTPQPSYRAYQCLCALFDGQTSIASDRSLSLVDQQEGFLQKAMFTRDGRGIWAYWYPADLQKGWLGKPISLRLGGPADALPKDSVLVDTLTGTAYGLTPTVQSQESVAYQDIPLLDYPLLITEAKALA